MEQTISPRQLRRWFGRVALTLLITFVVSQALSYLDDLRRLDQLHHPDVPQRLLRLCPQYPPHPSASAQSPSAAARSSQSPVWAGEISGCCLFPRLRLSILLCDLGAHPCPGRVRGTVLRQCRVRHGVCPAAGDRHFDLRGGRPCGRGIYLPSAAAGSGAYLR